MQKSSNQCLLFLAPFLHEKVLHEFEHLRSGLESQKSTGYRLNLEPLIVLDAPQL